MTGTPFEVEGVLEAAGRGYVVARLLEPSAAFEVRPGARLGGCPIERWLDVPRAVDTAGNPRTDLFAFCLTVREDLAAFAVGRRVLLTVEGGTRL